MNISPEEHARPPIPAGVPAGVCAAWFADRPLAIRCLAASGFSGAALHLVQPVGSADRFVLKAFRAGMPRARAAWIHELMRHATTSGVKAIPEVMHAHAGSTLVTAPDGGLWELVRFVPGTATAAPTPAQAVAAAQTLALFHRAAASLPGSHATHGPPPAVTRRIEQARELLARPWAVQRRELPRPQGGDRRHESRRAAGVDRWDRAIAVFAAAGGRAAVEAVAGVTPAFTSLQPVIRDIWSDHVLFDDAVPSRVRGVVDFHAAAIDAPATDLARLLGSWRPAVDRAGRPLPDRWPEPLAAYDSIRRLAVDDRLRVAFLHATAVLCGLDNWFRWIVIEERQFADWEAVLGRIDRHIDELAESLEWLAGTAWRSV